MNAHAHAAAAFSPWAMFLGADPVVQAVMVGLVLASLAVWTVLVAKSLELYGANASLKHALAANERTRGLEGASAAGAATILTRFAVAARAELALSADALSAEGVKERVTSLLEGMTALEARRIARGLGLVATIGATAPFIGLFGTVWGIMNSFIGISAANATSLAVVAPGIAEALLATACGLIAAIPAVVVYNHFTRVIGAYRGLVAEAAASVLRLLSRDLDRVTLGLRADRVAAE